MPICLTSPPVVRQASARASSGTWCRSGSPGHGHQGQVVVPHVVPAHHVRAVGQAPRMPVARRTQQQGGGVDGTAGDHHHVGAHLHGRGVPVPHGRDDRGDTAGRVRAQAPHVRMGEHLDVGMFEGGVDADDLRVGLRADQAGEAVDAVAAYAGAVWVARPRSSWVKQWISPDHRPVERRAVRAEPAPAAWYCGHRRRRHRVRCPDRSRERGAARPAGPRAGTPWLHRPRSVDTVFSERAARTGAEELGARLRAPVWEQVQAGSGPRADTRRELLPLPGDRRTHRCGGHHHQLPDPHRGGHGGRQPEYAAITSIAPVSTTAPGRGSGRASWRCSWASRRPSPRPSCSPSSSGASGCSRRPSNWTQNLS
ncbi:hypothetical protein SALBM311S_03284 [Streptomyces alboniger]